MFRTPQGEVRDPQVLTVEVGVSFWRVHPSQFPAQAYNPGPTPAQVRGRFSFFGQPTVPVLYAAQSREAAVGETIIRDVPARGGFVEQQNVVGLTLSRLHCQSPQRLLDLRGDGLRRVRMAADELTRTPPSKYASTVAWAEAAYTAGLDGIAWMTRHHDSSMACVFFGRPDRPAALAATDDLPLDFGVDEDLDWLTIYLESLGISLVE